MSRAELFRILGDPNRLRIMTLLGAEELSVGELETILGVSQSTVSGHLAQLRRLGLVSARRDGAHTRYQVAWPEEEEPLVRLAAATPLSEADRHALDQLRAARAPTPDGLGPDYLPGRSWEALAGLLLALLPPLRIADIGVGTGQLTRLLAPRAARLIAIDTDPAALAGLEPPIEPRLGRLEDPPLTPGEVELILLSQSLHCVEDPVDALRRCYAVLPPGGRIAVLDLAPHDHLWVRHRLGHRHLGFADLGGMLVVTGFHEVTSTIVHRDRRAPAFSTVLATGTVPTTRAVLAPGDRPLSPP